MSQPLPVDQLAPVALPGRIGQGTAVEQSRAVAEVQAAIIVAQQVPRSMTTARTAMQESCAMPRLAERAFYRYSRGGKAVQGASVHLARELARCWGNVQYGISELRRDDQHGQSEMQAWAWDVQTNARSSHTFIVPHARDKSGGPQRLTDLRDIYENNANMGARRLREAIFSILPPWFTAEAEDIAVKALEQGDGKSVEERVAGAIASFERLGVPVDRLEQKLGRSRDRWTGYDLAQLRITHRSIERGELTVDDEFPQARVTVDEIRQQAPAPAPATPAPPADVQDPGPATEPAKAAPAGPAATRSQLTAVNTMLGIKYGVTGDARFPVLADLIERDIESTSELTKAEARTLIDHMSGLPDHEAPAADGPGTEPM